MCIHTFHRPSSPLTPNLSSTSITTLATSPLTPSILPCGFAHAPTRICHRNTTRFPRFPASGPPDGPHLQMCRSPIRRHRYPPMTPVFFTFLNPQCAKKKDPLVSKQPRTNRMEGTSEGLLVARETTSGYGTNGLLCGSEPETETGLKVWGRRYKGRARLRTLGGGCLLRSFGNGVHSSGRWSRCQPSRELTTDRECD